MYNNIPQMAWKYFFLISRLSFNLIDYQKIKINFIPGKLNFDFNFYPVNDHKLIIFYFNLNMFKYSLV